MPEVHILGEVMGASGFDTTGLFCQWKVVTGNSGNWVVVRGTDEGQTQVDDGPDIVGLKADKDMDAVWAHPIDIQYATSSILGWPKLYVEVWHHDGNNRNELVGYGFCHIPATEELFTLDIATWRPEGTLIERVSASFIGGKPQLVDPSIVYSCGSRFELNVKSAGIVYVNIQVLHRELVQRGAVFA